VPALFSWSIGARDATLGVAFVAAAITTTACRDTPAAFGPTPAAARARGDELFEGLEQRFTHLQRSPEFAAARAKLGRGALVPSRVYDDTAVWTGMTPDGVHTLIAAGHHVGDGYVFAMAPTAPRPARLADSRHEIGLAGLGHGEFQWTTQVDQALGAITAQDIDHVLGAMLRAAATTPGPDLRAGSRAAFPHTASALGRLYSLDTVSTIPVGDGTALVNLGISLHPDELRSTYPAYAAYIHKYVGPVRMDITLTDAGSNEWFDLRLDDNLVTITLRATADGHLAPRTGPARPMPDSLIMRADFRGKVWIFSIGFSDLVGDFVPVRTDHEREWQLHFRHEPRWHFPLLTDHLVKSSLRRPFAGEGAFYRIGIRDSADTPTMLARAGRVNVQESTIMRWLGGMGSTAMGDFAGVSEAEENAFFADALAALRADLRDAPGLAGENVAPPATTGSAPGRSGGR
jgi:hypothetical protein